MNSELTPATSLSPFKATKGYMPRSGLEPPASTKHVAGTALRDIKAADHLIERIAKLKEFLTWNLH
jgi:hypothetical protein